MSACRRLVGKNSLPAAHASRIFTFLGISACSMFCIVSISAFCAYIHRARYHRPAAAPPCQTSALQHSCNIAATSPPRRLVRTNSILAINNIYSILAAHASNILYYQIFFTIMLKNSSLSNILYYNAAHRRFLQPPLSNILYCQKFFTIKYSLL